MVVVAAFMCFHETYVKSGNKMIQNGTVWKIHNLAKKHVWREGHGTECPFKEISMDANCRDNGKMLQVHLRNLQVCLPITVPRGLPGQTDFEKGFGGTSYGLPAQGFFRTLPCFPTQHSAAVVQAGPGEAKARLALNGICVVLVLQAHRMQEKEGRGGFH